MIPFHYLIGLFCILIILISKTINLYLDNTDISRNRKIFNSLFYFLTGYIWCMAFCGGFHNKITFILSIISGFTVSILYIFYTIVNSDNKNNTVNKESVLKCIEVNDVGTVLFHYEDTNSNNPNLYCCHINDQTVICENNNDRLEKYDEVIVTEANSDADYIKIKKK